MSTCPCGTAQATSEYLLQQCPPHDNKSRHAAWPEDVSQKDKLYLSLEASVHTAAFIRVAGVSM